MRNCKRRGMRAPVLAMVMGRWGSGRPCGMCSRHLRSSGVVSTSTRICLLYRRRPGCAAPVLRLPSRTPGAPPHDESDRVDLRDGTIAAAGGSCATELAMASKLIQSAQTKWRAVTHTRAPSWARERRSTKALSSSDPMSPTRHPEPIGKPRAIPVDFTATEHVVGCLLYRVLRG